MCYITFLIPTIIIIIYPQLLHLYHSWDCGGSFQAVRERPYAIAVPRHSLQASLGFTLDIQNPKSYRARKQIHCFLVPVRSSWQTSYFVDCLIAMKCVRKVCEKCATCTVACIREVGEGVQGTVVPAILYTEVGMQ